MIVVTHRPTSNSLPRIEWFEDGDVAAALARVFDLRRDGASQLVMLDATIMNTSEGRV